MIQKALVDLVTKYLGKYVKDLNSESFKIAGWQGDIELNNLQLHPDALSELDLPISVKEGILGRLHIKIPWTNLRNESTIIRIEQILLVAGPRRSFNEWDEEKHKQKLQADKMKRLAEAENRKLQRQKAELTPFTPAKKPTSDSFLTFLIAKIVSNVQIFINDIHIRYEDEYSNSKNPFSLGITLEHLFAQTTNEDFIPGTHPVSDKLIFKFVSLRNFGVYWNSGEGKLKYKDTNELKALLLNMIYRGDEEPSDIKQMGLNYLLKPINAEVKLRINKSNLPDMEIPKYVVDVHFGKISVCLSEDQFRDLQSFADWVVLIERAEKYRKHRPPTKRPKEDPLAWWSFAGRCIMSEKKEVSSKWSREYIHQRRKTRIRYTELYRTKLKTRMTNPQLIELEEKLSFEDIFYFRSLAEMELKREQQAIAQRAGKRGLMNSVLGMFGWGKAPVESESTPSLQAATSSPIPLAVSSPSLLETAPTDVWSPELRKELYDTIEYSPAAVDTQNKDGGPKNWVKTTVSFCVDSISLTLKICSEIDKGTLLKVSLLSISGGLIAYPDALKLNGNLEFLEVSDRYTPNTQFAKILLPISTSEGGALFSFNFEVKPFDAQGLDYRFSMALKPMDIAINMVLIFRLADFFSPPNESESLHFNALENAAQKHFDSLKALTQEQLTTALNNHKTMGVSVEINAPRILIPEDVMDPNSPLLVIDLGSISVQNVSQERTNTVSEAQLEDSFYEKYTLKMAALHMSLTNTTNYWRSAGVVAGTVQPFIPFVDKFDINFSLNVLMVDPTALVAKLKFVGFISSLKFFFAADTCHHLYRIALVLAADPPNLPPKQQEVRLEHSEYPYLDLIVDDEILDVSTTENLRLRSAGEKIHMLLDNKVVDFYFSIEKISGTLSSLWNRRPNRDLARLELQTIALEVVVRDTKDTQIFMALNRLLIEDLIETSPRFRYLAISDDTEQAIPRNQRNQAPDEQPHEKPNDLVKVSFLFLKKNSPRYQGMEYRLDLSFHRLFLNCNCQTVIALLNYIDLVLPPGEVPPNPWERIMDRFPTVPKPRVTQEGSSLSGTRAKKKKSDIMIRVTAQLDCLKLTLNRNDRAFATGTISSSSAQVQYWEDDTMEIKALLGNLSIEDCVTESRGPRDVFRVKGDHLVEVFYKSFLETDEDFSGYHSWLRVRLNSVRYIFIQSFITELLRYLSDFSALKATLLAAETKKKPLQSSSSTTKITPPPSTNERFKYDVLFNNPLVVVPACPKQCREALILDLGQIYVFNNYSTTTNPEGRDVDVEHISFALSGLNLKSIPKMEAAAEQITIVDDVNVLVQLESVIDEKDHTLPALSATGRISDIRIRFNDWQYKLFFQILGDNLRELNEPRGASSRVANITEDSDDFVDKPSQSEISSGPLVLLDSDAPPPEVYKLQAVFFQLGAVSLSLYRAGDVSNDLANLVSCFKISDLQVKRLVLSDQSEKFDAVLQTIELVTPQVESSEEKEMSHGRRRIHNTYRMSNLLGSSNNNSIEFVPQLRLHFEKMTSGDSRVTVFLHRLQGTLLPGAVMSILEFVWPAMEFFSPPPPSTASHLEEEYPSDQREKSIEQPLQPLVVTDSPQPRFTAFVHIQDPELHFPEDAMNPSSSRVVFKLSTTMNYSTQGDTQDFWCVLNQFEIFKRETRGNQTREASILRPLDLVFESSQSTSNCTVSLVVEPLHVTFSYQDYILVSSIVKAAMVIDVSKMKTQDGPQSTVTPALPPQTPNTLMADPIDQWLSVKIASVRATVLDDRWNQNVPLVDFRINNFSASVANWSHLLRAELTTDVEASNYNTHIALWEPLIEPWGLELRAEKVADERNPLEIGKTKYEMKARTCLNINISKAFFDTARQTVGVWTGEEKPVASNLEGFHSLYIRNETGQLLRFWVQEKDIPSQDLRDGETVPLFDSMAFSRRQRREELLDEHPLLCAQLSGGWDPISNLPTNRIRSYPIALTPTPQNTEVRVVYDVSFVEGKKIVSFKSNVELVNECNIAIDVMVDTTNQRVYTIERIQPGAKHSIPLQFASRGALRFRPSPVPSSRSSEPPSDLFLWTEDDLRCNRLLPSTHLFRALPKTSQPKNVHFTVQVDGGDELRYQALLKAEKICHGCHRIVVTSPLIIDNLLAVPLQFRVAHEETNQAIVEAEIKMGENIPLYEVPTNQQVELFVRIGGFNWSKGKAVRGAVGEIWVMQILDARNRPLNIHIEHSVTEQGTKRLFVYCQYWMINKTGLRLLYQQRNASFDREKIAAGQSNWEEQKEIVQPDEQKEWYAHDPSKTKPLMYSYSSFDLFGNKTTVRVANSKWSKSISLESAGTFGEIRILEKKTEDPRICYNLAVAIDLAPGKFRRTKVITFSPRFVVINKTNRQVSYKQKNTECEFTLAPNESSPFHWPDKKKPEQLCVSFGADCTWSGGFFIDEITDFAVKFKTQSTGETYIMPLEIINEKASFFIVFREESKQLPPYRIDNCTTETLYIYQKGLGEQSKQSLSAYESSPYTWDEPTLPHRLILEVGNTNFSRELSLDKIKEYEPIYTQSGKMEKDVFLKPEVFADGPTRVLRVTDLGVHQRGKRDDNRIISLASITASPIADRVETEFNLSLKGIGVSLVDLTPQELIYFYIKKIKMEYINGTAQESLMFTVGTMQIDNQLHTSPFPVLLSTAMKEGQFFKLAYIKSKLCESIDFFYYCAFMIHEVDICLDERTVNLLFDFININMDALNSAEIDFDHLIDNSLVPSTKLESRKVYFRLLHMNPIKITLTFSTFYGEGIDHYMPNNNLVRNMLHTIGVVMVNIDHAPILLNALLVEHAFSTQDEISKRIASHYIYALLYELYKVLGSFDFLGNPVSLVSNLGTGFHDFFYEPANGLVTSPKEFGEGLKKGATSLVKNSVVGIFNTASKLTDTIGKGVASLSLDPDYVRKREKSGRERPKHFGEGIALGAKEFTKGFFRGLAGVVVDPIKGAKKEGMEGLMKGVAQGLIGVAVKPGVAIFDFATRASQGIRNTATYFDSSKRKERIRLPRYFAPDKRMTTYSPHRALGQSMLMCLEDGKYSHEWYLFQASLPNGRLFLVSNKHVFCVIPKRIPILEWKITLKNITKITKVMGALVLHEIPKVKAVGFGVGTNKSDHQRIELPDDSQIDRLFESLDRIKNASLPSSTSSTTSNTSNTSASPSAASTSTASSASVAVATANNNNSSNSSSGSNNNSTNPTLK